MRAANQLGFRISEVALERRTRSQPRRNPGPCRHHRALVAVVSRCCQHAHTAACQSMDRRRHRAQTLSGPPAHRDQGTQTVRALAEGRPRLADRRRRHRAGNNRAARVSRGCRSWSATAPNSGAQDFLALIATLSGDRAVDRGVGAGRRAALESASERRRRSSCCPRAKPSGRCERWSISIATRNCSRATSPQSICACRPRDRAAVRRRRSRARAGAQGCREGEEAKTGKGGEA